MASDRTKKIVQLAVQQHSSLQHSPLPHITRVGANDNNNSSFINALSPVIEALSPEQIVDLINNATVVLESDNIDLECRSAQNIVDNNQEPIFGAINEETRQLKLDQTNKTDELHYFNAPTVIYENNIDLDYLSTQMIVNNNEEPIAGPSNQTGSGQTNKTDEKTDESRCYTTLENSTFEKTENEESEDTASNYSSELVNSESETSSENNQELTTEKLNGHETGIKMNKKKKTKGVNKRINSEQARMLGQKYLGFRKPRGQKNSFHDTERQERKLKKRCDCKRKAKDSAKRCFLVCEKERKDIFQQFWQNMNWDQRKIYVCNTISVNDKQRPKNVDRPSRRTCSLKYSLIVKNEKIPVCKKMYLGTLALGEWSAREWALRGKNGMNESQKNIVQRRKRRKDLFSEDRDFLTNFLNSLNKLPSHYCRKETDKQYLEQVFQSSAEIYRTYVNVCEENQKVPLSITCLTKKMEEMKISIFKPRKDQCDTCFKFKNGNLTEDEYKVHMNRKENARKEKENDKNEALQGNCHVITMDVQSVKLAPQLPASALYYKTKLCCHNYTLYNLATHQATCYWFDETQADGQAATYASFLVDYLEEHFLAKPEKKEIIIFSDGCTAQNRNSILANALLYLSDKYKVSITQKFLEKGHTQMECDSVHATIERALKNQEIHLPSDYFRITKTARKISPYEVKNMDYSFFRNFGEKSVLKYDSIRPTKSSNGHTVTDIRVLKYNDNKIMYKLNFADDYQDLPTRPKKINLVDIHFAPLYKNRLPISKIKYGHLQSIKSVLPQDCWSYYDLLPHKEQ